MAPYLYFIWCQNYSGNAPSNGANKDESENDQSSFLVQIRNRFNAHFSWESTVNLQIKQQIIMYIFQMYHYSI